jgi:membrane protease subunit HflK
MQRISIDDFFDSTDPNAESALLFELTGLNSYCITGDNNLVNLVCIIQYNIDNPKDYLFNIIERERVLRELAASSIIHTLAGMPIDEILTSGKLELERDILALLQDGLDELGCGLNASFVEVRDVGPPSKVQKAFEDVINAQIDKKKMISEAESYKNQMIPKAKADAAAMLEQAKAYKNEVIANAEGETERFLALLAEYKKAPRVTRRRIYLETMAEIFQSVKQKYIVEEGSNNYRLFVP